MRQGAFEDTYIPKFIKGTRAIKDDGSQISIYDVDLEEMVYLYKFLFDDGTRSKVFLGHCRDIDNLYRPWRAGARLLEL